MDFLIIEVGLIFFARCKSSTWSFKIAAFFESRKYTKNIWKRRWPILYSQFFHFSFRFSFFVLRMIKKLQSEFPFVKFDSDSRKRKESLIYRIQIISNVSRFSKFQEFQSRARILEFCIRFIVHEIAISTNARPNNDSNTWYSRMHLINSFWFVVAGFIQLAFDIISFVSLVSFYYRCRN